MTTPFPAMRFKLDNPTKSGLYGFLAGVGTLAAICGVYKLVQYLYTEDEYFSRITWKGGVDQRRILVLGLDGAGKSRLLQCFQRGIKPGDILQEPDPTIAFNIRSAGIAGIDYHFWDVNGAIANRRKWCQFLYDIDVLLWVVDSSNPGRFEESKQALHEFISELDKQEEGSTSEDKEEHSQYGIPIVIVATKQDKQKSATPCEIYDKMEPGKLTSKHKVYLIGTEIPNNGHRRGLWRVYELISFATKKRYQRTTTSTAV